MTFCVCWWGRSCWIQEVTTVTTEGAVWRQSCGCEENIYTNTKLPFLFCRGIPMHPSEQSTAHRSHTSTQHIVNILKNGESYCYNRVLEYLSGIGVQDECRSCPYPSCPSNTFSPTASSTLQMLGSHPSHDWTLFFLFYFVLHLTFCT